MACTSVDLHHSHHLLLQDCFLKISYPIIGLQPQLGRGGDDEKSPGSPTLSLLVKVAKMVTIVIFIVFFIGSTVA